MMKPEIKARWVAALRSGTYKQGQHALRKATGEHCCLGVLCDLYAQETGEEFELLENPQEPELPAPKVCKWAGLDPNELVAIGGSTETLYNHNDGRGPVDPSTFAEIAAAIEEQL